MKKISGNHHDIRSDIDDLVHDATERLRDVGLALVDALRCLAAVLPEPEMEVSEMGELHGQGMTRNLVDKSARTRASWTSDPAGASTRS